MKKILLIALILCSYTLSEGQEYQIDSMHIKIDVGNNGIINIQEQILVDFYVPKRGIIRQIPYQNIINNHRYNIDIFNVHVPKWAYKSSRKSGRKNIRIGNKNIFLEGKQTYTIDYKVKGPFIRSDSYDEFYWNLTGNRWDANIHSVTFEVNFPDISSIRYNDIRYFTGRNGANNKDLKVESKSNLIIGKSTQPLPPGHGATIAVKLPSGFITNQNNIYDPLVIRSQKEKDIKLTSIPLLLFILFLRWWKSLRRFVATKGKGFSYYPPDGYSSAVVGTFIDDQVHNRDAISLILYWASQGFIEIHRLDKSDILFQKLKELDDNRPAYENDFFHKLFNHQDTVLLSTINEDMYDSVALVKKEIKNDVYSLHWYDQEYIKWFKTWRILILGLVVLIAGIVFIALFNWVITGILMLVLTLIIYGFAIIAPPPSNIGKRIKSEFYALKNFLKDPNAYDLSKLFESNPNYLNDMFPYVYALGLDKTWEDISKERDLQPSWYIDNHSTSSGIGGLVEGFSPKNIESAFHLNQTSSSSSSFSGGSSGGGFGGGGGSSW